MFRYLTLAALALLACCLITYEFLNPRVTKVELVMATGSEGGVYYPLGTAIAGAVHDEYPHINIKAITTDGSAENRDRIISGAADLGLIQNDAQPHPAVRTLMPLHLETFHFFVRRESGIATVGGLTGQRAAIGTPDSGTRRIAEYVLSHFGVDLAKLQLIDASPNAAKQKLIAGEIDALFYMGSTTADVCQELLADAGVRLVSFGQDDRWHSDVPALRRGYPYIEPVTIPRGLFYSAAGDPRPSGPIYTFGLRSLLVSHQDLPETVARAVVAAITQHRSMMMREIPLAAQISEDFSARDIHIRLHDGAQAYFDRREPGFLERYAESMAFIMSAGFAIWGAIAAVRKAMNRGKKDRIDLYYVALNESIERLEQRDLTLETIDEINHELNRLRTQAIGELTRERLLADESFQIFQSLLSDCQAHLATQRRRLDALNRSDDPRS